MNYSFYIQNDLLKDKVTTLEKIQIAVTMNFFHTQS